jgi:hypothetical protein
VDNGDCKKSSLLVPNFEDFWELHLKIFLVLEESGLPSIFGVSIVFFLPLVGVYFMNEDDPDVCLVE